MKYYSYVIYAPESGSFYYGYFTDLEKALELHNSNQIQITQGKGPWVLLFSESYENRLRAIRQANFYRSVKGQRFLRNVLNF
ncbi:MAG: GIY-YIG nuclease family protein [Prolixibacteraceae bacterium]|nr:GIY-YIG nuclease family protein [Prolixibacteraceae bacterium]